MAVDVEDDCNDEMEEGSSDDDINSKSTKEAEFEVQYGERSAPFAHPWPKMSVLAVIRVHNPSLLRSRRSFHC